MPMSVELDSKSSKSPLISLLHLHPLHFPTRTHSHSRPAMAKMLMPSPRSLVLLLLLATPFFVLLPNPSSASSHASLRKYTEEVNEAHVVVLTAANFSSFLDVRRHVVVDFYAPWSYWSRKLAPVYAAAASHLADKGLDVTLAKVDATQDRQLARAHGVDGYPTVLFFVDGMARHYPYYGERTKALTVMSLLLPQGWKISRVCTGLSTSTVKLFHVDPEAKRPSLVLLNKQLYKLTVYDGEFRASAIAEFVSANKIPLITYHPHTGSRPSDV
ncbi:hypothetical protein VPH35_107616 [Triticum aestivum]